MCLLMDLGWPYNLATVDSAMVTMGGPIPRVVLAFEVVYV